MAKVCDECGGSDAYNSVSSCKGFVEDDLCDKCYNKWKKEKPERDLFASEEYKKKKEKRLKEKAIALVEKIAPLEHEQWAHWTKYILDNLTDENIERWKIQCQTDYKDLSEEEKESDRVWARKLLDIDEIKPRIRPMESIFW